MGTAQFGMDYGIANVSGKPTKKEVFGILDLACENGFRRFDTAPSYGTETLLGEFMAANGLRDESKVLTRCIFNQKDIAILDALMENSDEHWV